MRNTCVVPQCQNCSLATAERCRNSFWFTKLSNARLKPGSRSRKWYRNLEIWTISSFHHKVCFLVLRLHLICPRTGLLSRSIKSSIVDSEVQGRSKPELENLEPRTQDLARFWNCVLFQAEPRKMMWRCDEIVSFLPSSRKIVTFLEVLKKTFSKPGSVTSNLECDEMWRKCYVTSFGHRPSLKPRSRFWENTQSLNQFHFNPASVALISNLEIMSELESACAAGSSAAATWRVSDTTLCDGPSHRPMQSASWYGKTKQTKEQSREANTWRG